MGFVILILGICSFTFFGVVLSQEIPIIIRDVTIIDVVEGRLLPGMAVTIRGGKVESIVETNRSDNLKEQAQVIQGKGKFLIPGLWDMHTHFTADSSTRMLYIAHGITGVRDMGSIALKRVGDSVEYLLRDDAIKLIIQTRNDVRRGKILGPTIFTPGMIVTGPNPNAPNAPAAPHQIVVRTEKESRSTVNHLADMGVDFIKVHARLSRETFFAIIDESKKRGLPVAGHVPLSLNPIEVSRAGQKSIEHLTGVWEYAHEGLPTEIDSMDPQKFQAEIAEFKKNHTWQVPTLVSYFAGAEAFRIINDPDSEPMLEYVVPELALRWMDDWSRSDFTPQQSKEFRESVVTLQRMTKEISHGGVGILAGSDFAGIFTYAGISLHKELDLLHKAGLSAMQTLQAATIRPAEFLGISDKTGSISEGKSADLVLLRADPIEDITNADSIEAVFLHGKIFSRKDLDSMLEQVRDRSKTTRGLMETLPWSGDR